MKFYGGKAIASGSYGCVFYPSLKCKNKKSKSLGVSKLMLKKDAKKEYDDIIKIKKKISVIPNYQDYFILALEKCEPERLTNEDIEDMDENCKRFFNAKKKIEDYEIINIPFGGIDIDFYFKSGIDVTSFLNLNKSLKNTIINGVIPMNKLNIYHLDLKIDNFLINEKNQIKIIDWGFTIFHNNDIPNIDYDILYRSFNFNLPYSIILFSDMYVNLLNTYINKMKNDNTIINTQIISKYIREIFKKYDEETKHYKVSNIIIKIIIQELDLKLSSEDIIFNYLGECVFKYIKKDKNEWYFDDISLFNEVFLKNCDIFGSLTTYFSLLEFVQYYSQIINFKNEENKNKFKKQLSSILYNHLLKNGTDIININKFFNDINKLKIYFRKKSENTKKKMNHSTKYTRKYNKK